MTYQLYRFKMCQKKIQRTIYCTELGLQIMQL